MGQLIDKFKKATSFGTWRLMDELSISNVGFSTTYTGQLTADASVCRTIQVYWQDNDLVLVLKEAFGSNESILADEERFADELPQYFSEGDHFVSPAFLLLSMGHNIRHTLRRMGLDQPNVYGVVLTDAYIVNKDDMADVWEWLGIRIIDTQALREVRVRDNHDSPEGRRWLDFLTHRPMWDFEVNDDFDHTPGNIPVADSRPGLAPTPRVEDFTGDGDGTREINVDLPAVGELAGVQIIKPILCPRTVLDRLIGLHDVKRRIGELTMLSLYNKRLGEIRGKTHAVSLHGLFLGNPGTGKTTVARLLASMYLEAGLLSKGHVVLCNGRQPFISPQWGGEEKTVEKILTLAEGGMLCIDEAYTLVTNHQDDPGRQVLPLLMQRLADQDERDISIVLMGYRKPMERLLSSNPGLDSRFPQSNRFLFPDFTPGELGQIAMSRLRSYGYALTPAAWRKLRDYLAASYAARNEETFGNGRFVENLLEDIYVQHALRIMRKDITDQGKILQIVAADIQPAVIPPAPKPAPPRQIGFRP